MQPVLQGVMQREGTQLNVLMAAQVHHGIELKRCTGHVHSDVCVHTLQPWVATHGFKVVTATAPCVCSASQYVHLKHNFSIEENYLRTFLCR